jgi:hypothetical protein
MVDTCTLATGQVDGQFHTQKKVCSPQVYLDGGQFLNTSLFILKWLGLILAHH